MFILVSKMSFCLEYFYFKYKLVNSIDKYIISWENKILRLLLVFIQENFFNIKFILKFILLIYFTIFKDSMFCLIIIWNIDFEITL